MKQKRILLLGGNFYPELTGVGKYNGEMVDFLAKSGYDCTVITSYPYYPFWKVQAPYKRISWWYRKETKKVSGANTNVTIYRCPQYVPSTPSGSKRILLDFSFCLSCFLSILPLLFKRKFDHIIAVAPSFQVGLIGLFYSKIKRAQLIYHIQDLQIDAARDLEMIKSKRLINVLLSVERFILKHADIVSSISPGMIKRIEAKCGRTITYFPNWVDTKSLYPMTEKIQLKESFGFSGSDFIVLYSGAIGEKQGLEDILHTANLLSQVPNLKFVICGSGPYKENLLKLKESLGIENVFFLSLQPFEKLNALLNMADVHLVLQKANASDLVMPSKLTSILSVGGVALVTTSKNSSLFEMVNTNKIGVVVEPENKEELTVAIKRLMNVDKEKISNNAFIYAQQNFSIDTVFSRFTRCLI